MVMPILKESIVEIDFEIVVELNWSNSYHFLISIIREFITLRPFPRSYQDYDKALEIFKNSILDEASHLTKLAAVTYGFVAKFPPSTIALAALLVTLENQCSSTNIAIFNLIRPIAHFTFMFEHHELGLSFGDKDVKQCRKEMLHLLKSCPGRDIRAKSRPSPTNVTETPGVAAHSVSR